MGDALAVAVLKSRGFSRDDFARSHPGGTLGRRLLIYVRDVMHTHDDMPLVTSGSQLTTALEEMSAKGLGMTGIVNAEGHLIGIYTDGDIRRSINQSIDVQTTVIDQVMVSDPRSTTADALAAEVVQLMRQHSINGLFAVDPEQRPIGALNTLDLMRAGIF